MSASMTDRNLLFGVLALQMDFVSQDQLVEAMKRWVDDKQRPLGELLIDVSALTPEIRELLESVVEKHLEVHDGDAQRSLQAVHAIAPNLQDSLAGVGDDELNGRWIFCRYRSRWETSQRPTFRRQHLGATRFSVHTPEVDWARYSLPAIRNWHAKLL